MCHRHFLNFCWLRALSYQFGIILSVWTLQLSLGLTSAVTRGVSRRLGQGSLCSPWDCGGAGTEVACLGSSFPTLRTEIKGKNTARKIQTKLIEVKRDGFCSASDEMSNPICYPRGIPGTSIKPCKLHHQHLPLENIITLIHLS